MKFGSVIWAGLVLVILASILESYDPKLALLLVTVTLFALFMANAGEVTAVFRAITPR